MAYGKYIKRTAKKVGRVVKKRYFKGKGYSNPRLANMARDVMRLKQLVNVEKKRAEVNVTSFTVGQIFNSASVSGYYAIGVTPNPAQGLTSSTRIGNSIKLQSMILQMKLVQQTNTIVPIRLKIIFYKQVANPVATATSVTNNWEVNPFSGVLDYFSNRNPDNFTDIRVLRTAYVTIQPDNFSGQVQTQSRQFLFKLNHHLRWDNSGSISEGQIYMLILADDGDRGSAATAIQGQFTSRVYYTDN